MRRYRFLTLAFVAVAALPLVGCLDAPEVGKAAAPSTASSPMRVLGGATNTELNSKREALLALLDGKRSRADVDAKLRADMAHMDEESRQKSLETLQDVLQAVPGTVDKGRPMAKGPERDMLLARFYFYERRFIEAAEHLTSLLDARPDHPQARNLLARCFFFLGNPDRAIQELEYRLGQIDAQAAGKAKSEEQLYEIADSLFVIGAAIVESPGTSRTNLEKGVRAWEAYLELAPDSPAADRVKNGLDEMRAGLRGEGRLAQGTTAKPAAASGGPQGVMGGQASFSGPGAEGGMGPAAKAPERVKNLPPDATPFARALAAGLDALDERNPALAQGELEKAQALEPENPDVLTGLARIATLLGDTQGALRQFGEIIKRYPDHMTAWHYNGVAQLMGGDPGQAAQSWEHIQKVDPAYFAANNLAQRVQVAKRMAQGR